MQFIVLVDMPLTRLLLTLVAQSCLALCDPMDYSPPGCSVHGDSPGKNTGVGHRLDYMELFGRVMSLLFNTLSRFVIALLKRSNLLLISHLQSPTTVIL